MNRAVVATYQFRHEAELALTFLRAQGIEGAIMHDDAGGVYPGTFNHERLIVSADDLEAARAILAAEDAVEPPDDPGQHAGEEHLEEQ
jgi:hypothetical protein